MAGDAVVGVLRAIFGLDTSEFEDGAKKAASSMQSFGKQMSAIASGIGLEKIFESAAHAIVHLAAGALETADAMGKASQKFGVPIEQLSSLAHVAALSDLSLQQLGGGLGKLSKNMLAAQDSTSGVGIAFSALGISVKDSQGNLKSSETVLLEIAQRFSEFEDGATKTALAIKIFGKAGADMIPLLNQGADGIKKQREQAEKLGQVIGKETAKQAEEFNDSIKSLHRTIEALTLKILGSSGLLESMSHLSTKFIETAADAEAVNKVARNTKDIIFALSIAWDTLTISIASFTLPFRQILAAMANIAHGDFAGALESFTSRSKDFATQVQELRDKLLNMGKDGGVAVKSLAEDWDFFGEAFVKARNKVNAAPLYDEALTKSVADFIDATKKSIEVQQADIDAHGKGVGVREKLRVVTEGVNAAFSKGGALTKEEGAQIDALSEKIGNLRVKMASLQFADQLTQLKAATLEAGGAFAGTLAPGFAQAALSSELLKTQVQFVNGQLIITGEQARQLNVAMLGLNGAKLTAEFLDPFEQYRLKLEAINLLLANQKIGADTANKAMVKGALEVAIAYGTVAQSIVGNMATAFKDLAGLNKKYAGAAKALAIGEALVQTFLGATKAFTATITFGYPLAIAAAAAATAAGLANVAKISATQFQTGGSFKVGGSGGVDSQLISLRASPGEMVDVRRPGSTRGSASEVTLNLPRTDDFFSLNVRQMVDALNKAAPDGYVLKFAS